VKLQRLDLFGFKSFADRVSIEFNPGMTAIVGPNGCGKSNICDAIRWVLGEQRPTLVRGSKMDEVIFAGSRERKPIHYAEVVLHFSNEDGVLPVEYSEVSIARRIYREGEGEYLLNKHFCRLKDIQDLLMGTGIGTHAYSLIQQGMIDVVLSDRTDERRYLFEEAAGVTRYKTRRKAAERKLEATTQDLLRVEDIVAEVEKNVGALKRQVGKARRFREYEAEETRLDVHVAAREGALLATRREPLGIELKALETTDADQAARLAEREAELEGLELDLASGRGEEQAARAHAEDLRGRISRRDQSRLVTAETLSHNARRLEALVAEDERADEGTAELAARRASLERDRDEAAERRERIVARLEPEGDMAVEDEHHAERKAERARLVAEAQTLQERSAEARQAAARLTSAAEAAVERHAALAIERDERREALTGASAAAVAARERLAAARISHEEARSLAAERQLALRDAARRLEGAREQVAAARAAERAAASRHETLAALESRLEGYGEGARALLGAEAPARGIYGALPQAVEPIEPRFERPLDRYLESLGHALLARDRSAAIQGAEQLAEQGGGRADFLIPEFVPDGAIPELPDEAAAVVLAHGSDVARWTGDPGLAARLAPLFARLLVVADREAAFRCRSALLADPMAARHFAIAGLDGTLVEPTGRWRTAGDVGEEGLLARRRLLAEAARDYDERRAVLDAHERTLKEAEREVVDAEAALASAQVRQAEIDQTHRAAREEAAVAEQIEAQIAGRVTELEAAVAEEGERRDRAEAAHVRAAEAFAALERDQALVRERLEQVQGALERYEEVRRARLSARHAVELERAEAEAMLRAVEREIEHLTVAEESLCDARDERAAERARLEQGSAELEAERIRLAAEIEALYGDLDGATERLRESEARHHGIEERRARLETEIRALRREHEETMERRHRVSLALQDVDFRREALDVHLAQIYDSPLEALVERHPLTEEEAGLELDALRQRLEEVRRRRINLGPVNMLAVEEFEREAERLTFLQTQRDDLVRARRQLEEAIRKINETARALFLDTFERIREHYDETFRVLFEGGHADIRLADSDDPLESPIEIVASPRGKRVQHITLLSGGERALTALALLFAIYRVKPSPFCILDEVDAPLDDANISRFLRMIGHFSDRTQFIVITHNKRTMEAADYLYGVTMEEPGVSAIVSVSLGAEGERGGSREDEEFEEPARAWAAAG
jgi:chromosome segregation protein